MIQPGGNPAAERIVDEMNEVLRELGDIARTHLWSNREQYEPSHKRVLELIAKLQDLEAELIDATQARGEPNG